MSYDLAVWAGPRPLTSTAAAAEFRRLIELHHDEKHEGEPPTPEIAAYVQALLSRFPDIDEPAGDDSPWSTAPLMSEACGEFLYFPMGWSRGEEVSAWAADLALAHNLVCYDPQIGQLRPNLGERYAFRLESATGRTHLDPDEAAIRRVLVQLTRDQYYAILERADGWFVQAGFGPRAGARPGWYALERKGEGSFRTELTDVNEVIDAFLAFLADDPLLDSRFAWQAYDPS